MVHSEESYPQATRKFSEGKVLFIYLFSWLFIGAGIEPRASSMLGISVPTLNYSSCCLCYVETPS